MKIIVADDEELQLNKLESCVKNVIKGACITAFLRAQDIIAYIERGEASEIEIAFLDIEMGAISGIQIAKKLQTVNPRINIVFVTGYLSYAPQAFSMHVSGYVSKPVTEDKIRAEYENLRYPMPKKESEKRLKVKCFGQFDVTVDGNPLKFKREKTKELFAYLIDRNGAVCTPREICSVLWEDDKLDYLRQLTKDLKETLKSVGEGAVFIKRFKEYRIAPSLIECDYYDYIENVPYAVKAFKGEYMLQYSWAEETLSGIIQKTTDFRS